MRVIEHWARLEKRRTDGGYAEIGVVVMKEGEEPQIDLDPQLVNAEDPDRIHEAFASGDMYPGIGGPKAGIDAPRTVATYGREGDEVREFKHERLSSAWFDDVLATLPEAYRGTRIPPPGISSS
jgi:hypothetical protein